MKRFLGAAVALCLTSAAGAGLYCNEVINNWTWVLVVGNNTGRFYAQNSLDLSCDRVLLTGIDDCRFIHTTRWDCQFGGNVWWVLGSDQHDHLLSCNHDYAPTERVPLGIPCLSCTTRIEVSTLMFLGGVPGNFPGGNPFNYKVAFPNPQRRIIKCGPTNPGPGGTPK